jgi:hypothetical protein
VQARRQNSTDSSDPFHPRYPHRLDVVSHRIQSDRKSVDETTKRRAITKWSAMAKANYFRAQGSELPGGVTIGFRVMCDDVKRFSKTPSQSHWIPMK